jgi:hypothetical protein
MDDVCLAIGVGDAPPLDYLRGAVNGAHAIADWASKQGYRTKLLSDEVHPVELSDVGEALTTLLAGGADRLLLYFAGHGLTSGAGDDLWLLSRWDQVRRGASVALLRDRLLHYGISQLILMADACRTLPDANTRDVIGDPVLNRGPFPEKRPQSDFWFAASPARAAWMIPGRTPADSRCIFSGLLVEALAGAHPKAFEGTTTTGPITSFSLADFIEECVPPLAARYGATLEPAITTSIRPPLNVYVPAGPPPSPPITPTPWPDPDPSAAPIAGMGAADGSGRIQPSPGDSWSRPKTDSNSPIRSGSFSAFKKRLDFDNDSPSFYAVLAEDKAAIAATRSAEKQLVSASMAAFQAESRPTHFETGAGFALSGAVVQQGVLGPAATAQPQAEPGWWRIEPSASFLPSPWWPDGIPLNQPLPLLAQLTDGRWVGAAALPRFVLSFTVDEVGAQAVIYRSMDKPLSPNTERVMARLRAGALSREEAPELVELLRDSKHADPMLGVLSAYLHDSMGDLDNVRRTAFFFALSGQPIPFDIALLGRLEAHRDAKGLVRVAVPPVSEAEGTRSIPSYMKCSTNAIEGVLAGAFPWLRQGWGRLDPEGRPDLYLPGLAQLTPYLLPAPFTTLTAMGGSQLSHLLFPAS